MKAGHGGLHPRGGRDPLRHRVAVGDAVERDRLSTANGRLFAAEMTMNQFVGPPLGGLVAGTVIAIASAGSAAAYLLGRVKAGYRLLACTGSAAVARGLPDIHLLYGLRC